MSEGGADAPRMRFDRAAAPLALVLAFFFAALATIDMPSSESFDATNYHTPVIEAFAAQWPDLNLVDYPSATTPGWHLLMAMSYGVTGGHRFAHVLNMWFGAALVLGVYMGVRRCVSPWFAVGLAMPIAFSPHVLLSASSLTTDNLALLMAMVSLTLSIVARPTPMRVFSAGLASVGVVLVRQVFVWVVAPIGLIGLVATPLCILVPRVLRWRTETTGWQWGVLLASLFGVIAPAAVVAAFAIAWGGLVPDNQEMRAHFREGYAGAAFPYALTLIAIFGPAFVAPLWAMRPRDFALSRGMVISALVGLAASVIPQTQWAFTDRQYGWLWTLVMRFGRLTGGHFERVDGDMTMLERPFELIDGRTPLFHLTAPLGAMVLWVLWRGSTRVGEVRRASVLMLTMLGWLTAQGFNVVLAQRYFEPVLLMTLAWLASMAVGREDIQRHRWLIFAPAALGLWQIVVTFESLI